MNTETYSLKFKNGKIAKIEIPKKWRVTVGPTYPGKQMGDTAVRVYAGSKLKAFFPQIVMCSQDNMIKIFGDLYSDQPVPQNPWEM
jgi:hypothetical protein